MAQNMESIKTNWLFYIKDIFLSIGGWGLLLLAVYFYNLTSLIMENMFIGIGMDVLMIGLVFLLVGCKRKETGGLKVDLGTVYAFFSSLTLALIIQPYIENFFGLNDDSIWGFVILLSVVSVLQLYFESLIENNKFKFLLLSKVYSWFVVVFLFFVVLNYRVKVYEKIEVFSGYDSEAVFIMTESAKWILNNV